MKKKIIILIISVLLISIISYVAGLFMNISNSGLKVAVNVALNLLNGVVAIIAMKLTNIGLDINLKDKKQYLIGICIGLILSLNVVFIPLLFGYNIVGGHMPFSLANFIFNFLYFILIIGPVEELIFRVYVQETFISFFNKNKWIGVVITSVLFGFWHFINGSFQQVMFTTVLGLIFGFSKYSIKKCKYLSVAIGHGLYDFLIVAIRMFAI